MDQAVTEYEAKIKDLEHRIYRMEKEFEQVMKERLKPLMVELGLREEIQNKFYNLTLKNQTEVKVLKAVLRTPRMYDKFQHAVVRRNQTINRESLYKSHDTSFLPTTPQHVSKGNVYKNMANFVNIGLPVNHKTNSQSKKSISI